MKAYMKEYNKLSDAEKVRRLELIAMNYAAWLNLDNWQESPFLDVTVHWDEFKEALETK